MSEQTYGQTAAGMVARLFEAWGGVPQCGPPRTDAGRYVDFVTGGEEEGCEIRDEADLNRCRAEFERQHAAHPKGDSFEFNGRTS